MIVISVITVILLTFRAVVSQDNSTSGSPPSTAATTYWCPKYYNPITLNGTQYLGCAPQSCYHTAYSSYVCEELTIEFRDCSRWRHWQQHQYQILENGTFVAHTDDNQVTVREPGDYFVFWDTDMSSVTCLLKEEADPGNSSGSAPSDCVALGYPVNHPGFKAYYKLGPDGTLTLTNEIPLLTPNLHEIIGTDLWFCFPMSPEFSSCRNDGSYQIRSAAQLGTNPRMGYYMPDLTMTKFLICIPPPQTGLNLAGEQRLLTRVLYSVCQILSIIFLTLSLTLHFLIPNLNQNAFPILWLTGTMLVFYLTACIRNLAGIPPSEVGRVVLFTFKYISGLAIFSWLNVLSFDIWRAFSAMKSMPTSGSTKRKYFKFFLQFLYAFGIPIGLWIFVMVISYYEDVRLSLRLNIGIQYNSRLTDKKDKFYFLYVPIIIMLVVNLLCFISTVFNIRRAAQGTSMLNKNVTKQLLLVAVKLFVVLGICWFSEVIGVLIGGDEINYYFFDMVNNLQGVFIFIVYVANRRAIRLIAKRFGCVNLMGATTKDKSESTIVSSASVNALEMKPKS